MRLPDTRLAVETIMRQLKGFVPVGGSINIRINYDGESGSPSAEFTVIQCFGEEKRPLPEITEDDLFGSQRHLTQEESSAYEKGISLFFEKTGKRIF